MNASTCWWAVGRRKDGPARLPGHRQKDRRDRHLRVAAWWVRPPSQRGSHVGDRKRLVEKVRMLERWTAPIRRSTSGDGAETQDRRLCGCRVLGTRPGPVGPVRLCRQIDQESRSTGPNVATSVVAKRDRSQEGRRQGMNAHVSSILLGVRDMDRSGPRAGREFRSARQPGLLRSRRRPSGERRLTKEMSWQASRFRFILPHSRRARR
jgi:hypothetical protein